MLFQLMRSISSAVVKKVQKHLTGLTLVVALLLLPSYQLYDLESNVYDVQVKAKHLLADWSLPDNPPQIALVLVDDEARRLEPRRRLIQISPISRDYLTDLVLRLSEMQPKVIALDFALDLPSEKATEDDSLVKALNSAIKKGIQVVIATRLVQTGRLQVPLLPIPRYLAEVPVLTGHSHMLVSPIDHVIRQAEVAVQVVDSKELARLDRRGLSDQLQYYEPCDEGFCYWSFPSAVTLAAYPEGSKERLHKLRLQGPFWINFSQPHERVFESYSSNQVLSGKLNRELSDKIVLVGADYSDSYDRHQTPLSITSFPIGRFWAANPVLEQHLSGIKVQAYALHSLLAKLNGSNGVCRVGEFIPVIASLILAFLLFVVNLRVRRELWSFLVLTLPPMAYVFIAILLFQKNSLYFPIVRPLAAYLAVMGIVHYLQTAIGKTK